MPLGSPLGAKLHFHTNKETLVTATLLKKQNCLRTFLFLSATLIAGALTASAQTFFQPGNLVVSRSTYDNNPNNVQVGQILPPNCSQTTGSCAGAATNNGIYPMVFNNALVDGSFGITSAIYLDQYTTGGSLVNTLQVPNTRSIGNALLGDQLVTSFSSKSELALNLSLDGQYLTFMGYVSGTDNLDVSNSNTNQVVDPTNPVGLSYYRAVAQVDVNGNTHFTVTNAYSGNNGRAAILNNTDGGDFYYTAGNAGNGANPQPDGIIIGAGAQFITPLMQSEVSQTPAGMPTPLASFNVTQLGDKKDKIGKDDNFRGLSIYNNVVYYTKGSGSNGVNSVYWLDPTETICNQQRRRTASLGRQPAHGSHAIQRKRVADPGT